MRLLFSILTAGIALWPFYVKRHPYERLNAILSTQ